MRRRRLLATGTAVLAGTGLGCALMPDRAVARPAASRIPDVEVVDQHGRRHRFHSDLVRGRTVLVNVFFTACGEVCPLVTQNLRVVQDLLGERVGRDIFMYSISLQPELETPAILKDYAEQWEVRPGWRFLTGAPAAIERLRRGMGFASADPASDLVKDGHTGILRYGNDALDRWAGVPGLARPAWIVKAVTGLAGRASS